MRIGATDFLMAFFAFLALTTPSSDMAAQTLNGCYGGKKRPTSAKNISLLCTQTYQLQGPCDGTDAVTKVKIFGTPPQTDWRIKVWEPTAITIRGIELAQVKGGPVEWAMAGHNSFPDIMLILARGMNYGHAVFPAGTGMPLPAKSNSTEEDYLDFHIVCKGEPFDFWYKIEYTIP